MRRRASRIVARSRSAGGDPGLDVVAALLTVRTEAGDALGAREIKDNVSTLLGAGSDTVVVALTWAIFLLSQAPATRAIVEAEIDAVWDGDLTTSATLDKLVWTRAVIEEAMRLYPPAPLSGDCAWLPDEPAGAEAEQRAKAQPAETEPRRAFLDRQQHRIIEKIDAGVDGQ